MDFLTFWPLIGIGAIVILVALIFLGYWIPKKLGHRKFGVWLSLTLVGGLVLVIVLTTLQDYFFFKSDAEDFLSSQNISLKDDFKITFHDTDEILDAYRKFTLEISPSDKLRIIEAIKASPDFGQRELTNANTIHYEDDHSFVIKSKHSSGSGHVSLIEVIEVSKNWNLLTCYKYIP
jgi:hypothetical protein